MTSAPTIESQTLATGTMPAGTAGPTMTVLAHLSRAGAELERIDFEAMSAFDLSTMGQALARFRGQVALVEASFVERVAALHAQGSCAPPEDELRRHVRLSDKTASSTVRRASTLADMPPLAQALEAGRVSADHVDALTAMLSRLDPADRRAWTSDAAQLAWAAGATSPEDFRRHLAKRRRTEQDRAGVSTATREWAANRAFVEADAAARRQRLVIDADAVTAARLLDELRAEMDRMRRTGDLSALHPDHVNDSAHLRFYAAVNLLTGMAPDAPNRESRRRRARRSRTPIGVLVDLETLTDGLHDRSVCELADGTPLPVETVRRMACEAGIIPLVLSGDGVVLDEGRERRLATAEQRSALRAMYRTCAWPGCTVAFHDCEVHHIVWWDRHGRTDLMLLIPLCLYHHHLVHDDGWQISLDERRTLHIRRPDGTAEPPHPLQPLHDRPPHTADPPQPSQGPAVEGAPQNPTVDGAPGTCVRPRGAAPPTAATSQARAPGVRTSTRGPTGRSPPAR